MANVGELIGKLEKEAAGGGVPACAEDVDRMLAKAASEDMAAFFARLVESFLLRRGRRRGSHSIRGRNVLTVFGTARVRYPYFRKKGKDAAHPLEEFGIRRGMTARMREILPFCGSEGGSFASGRDILRLLTGADVSVSRLRAETLLRGNKCRKTIEAAAWDVREYPDRPLPEGCRRVPRTLVAMADGTCVPCVRADLVGVKGKNGEAGSRQVRVIRFFEFDTVTAKGRPVPIAKSSSFAATPSGMEELTSLVRRLGIARGSGTAPRMQCVADGEPALESMFRVDFPHAEFTNDFFHACEYLNKCIEAAGAADAGSEFKKARGILLRKGAEEAVKHIRACCADGLARSEEARSALEYLEKRKENMKYGKLRKEGLCISSSLIESTARILAGRCKRAGMHWRLENAVAVASIIAMRRSAV